MTEPNTDSGKIEFVNTFQGFTAFWLFSLRACIESLRRVKKFGVSERKVNISRGLG
jgi:hypothetical protein